MTCAKPHLGWKLGNIHCMTVLHKKSYTNKNTPNDNYATGELNNGSCDNQSKLGRSILPQVINCIVEHGGVSKPARGGRGAKTLLGFQKCMQSNL